jgi:hypothetical protein
MDREGLECLEPALSRAAFRRLEPQTDFQSEPNHRL